MASDEDVPSGSLARTRKLIGLAAKLGQSEASRALKSALRGRDKVRELKTRLDQAAALVQTLSHLKGAAMKAGQLLSIEAHDFLPPEVATVLSKLQDKGSSLAFEKIEEILKNELGPERFALLEDLSRESIASASIGQVHRATYRGQKIALKVQFPGVAESIDTDLNLLRKIAKGGLAITQRHIQIDDLFEELKKVLHAEVDYTVEATHLERYKQNLAAYPRYRIPEVYRDISTRHVLAMSFERGLKVRDWLQTSPDLDTRRYFGRLILDLYSLEFFKLGLVQTDPNFANFLFRPDTRELVLLDFGATRDYSPEFRVEYRKLLMKVRNESPLVAIEQAIEMGLINEKESLECREAFIEMLAVSLSPFDPDRQPFDFGALEYARAVMESTMRFKDLVRHSAPPHQIIFLHRKLSGVFSLLKTLKVDIDLTTYWREFVE